MYRVKCFGPIFQLFSSFLQQLTKSGSTSPIEAKISREGRNVSFLWRTILMCFAPSLSASDGRQRCTGLRLSAFGICPCFLPLWVCRLSKAKKRSCNSNQPAQMRNAKQSRGRPRISSVFLPSGRAEKRNNQKNNERTHQVPEIERYSRKKREIFHAPQAVASNRRHDPCP